MGSSSRLTVDAFMKMCDDFFQVASRPRLPDTISPPALLYSIWFLCLSIMFGVYKYAQNEVRPRPTTRQELDDSIAESHDPELREACFFSPVKVEPSPIVAPFYELSEAISNTLCPVEEKPLVKGSGESWKKVSVDSGETIQNSPLSSPSSSVSWLPTLDGSISGSTQVDTDSQCPGPLVHVYCTHVEQKIGKNGLISSITRPSYHVLAAHFPHVQTAFATSSERAFFNSQQELSASPIIRDPRCLDLQYRFSPSTNSQATSEVSFDEIITTIRRNRKAGQDTTMYVHVVRVKDVVPSVVLNYVYHGQRHRSTVSSASRSGEDVPQSTKIVNFRTHFIRVKHISPDTFLWDCARHITKSVKQDHGIILQTKDIAVEIYSQDQDRNSIRPFKIDSSDTVKAWIRDHLPNLLQTNGNMVQLQISAFKKT